MSRGHGSAFDRFVDLKFNGPEPMEAEQAEALFGTYSALGLTNLLIEAQSEGGFTEGMLKKHTPAAIKEADDPEAFETFWQWCTFMTLRYKWSLLPGMRKRSQRTPRSKNASRDGGTKTIKQQVIDALGGEKKALKTYEKLLKEHGTVDEVIKQIGVMGLTKGNLSNIIFNLRQAQE